MDFFSSVQSQLLDPYKPTTFELVAQQDLQALLSPTLRYVLAYYAQRYPRRLIRLATHFDEVYAGLMLLVESHFLWSWDGTFTQNLYGIKQQRAPGSSAAAGPRVLQHFPDNVAKELRLRPRDRACWLAVTVLLPYVREKLDLELQSRQRARLVVGAGAASPSRRVRGRAAAAFFQHYPRMLAAAELVKLAYLVAYTFNLSDFDSPLRQMLRLRLRRIDNSDMRLRAERELGKSVSKAPWLLRMAGHVLGSLRYVLPVSLMALKFLEWWNASGFSKTLAQKSAAAHALPPPASAEPAAASRAAAVYARHSRLCGICGHHVTNPTALETGYVFCYVCAHRWIEKHACCPVTGASVLTTGPSALRRLRV